METVKTIQAAIANEKLNELLSVNQQVADFILKNNIVPQTFLEKNNIGTCSTSFHAGF